jgi:MFS family permease
MAIVNTSQGFWPVLANRPFRRLWTGQWLSQTSLNTVNFVLIVLVERLTGSSVNLALMILSFTLPGVLFAPISGVVIDRWPKKHVLVASNAVRVVMVLGYLVLLRLAPDHSNAWVLLALYMLTFVMSTIGQFFNPAQAATIPFVVERRNLLAANSLFNLTLALSQVIGLIILGPLAVKLIGINAAFLVVAAMYGAAALLLSGLPRDEPGAHRQSAQSSWRRAIEELRDGAAFVVSNRCVLTSMTHLTLIASLVMTLAMLAPGISARVFHLAPEDAIIVFAPAGMGMLLAALLLGRWGSRIRKQRVVRGGLAAMAAIFALFGVLAWRFQTTNQPLVLDVTVIDLPAASAALILATVALSLSLGVAMSGVNIVSQTLLQEQTPEQLRGRVFSVQFMLNNLVGIPPMLAIGALADLIGIPQMLVGISGVIVIVLVITLRLQRRPGPAGEPSARNATSMERTASVESSVRSPDKAIAAEIKSEDLSLPLRPTAVISDSQPPTHTALRRRSNATR